MCLLFPILGFVKFLDVSTAAKVLRLCISVKNKKDLTLKNYLTVRQMHIKRQAIIA